MNDEELTDGERLVSVVGGAIFLVGMVAAVGLLLGVGPSLGMVDILADDPPPEVIVHTPAEPPYNSIIDVNAVGECYHREGGFTGEERVLVEVELTHAAYEARGVRGVSLVDQREIDSAEVSVGATHSDRLCAPYGNTRLVTTDGDKNIVDNARITIWRNDV